MKTSRLHIVASLVLFVLSAAILVSCEKHELETVQKPVDPQERLASLKDSASYTIDGKRYTCDFSDSFGKGNAGANRDSITDRWDADTVMYSSEESFSKQADGNSSDDGAIKVMLIKKYARNQLAPSPSIPALLQPKNFLEHYKPGQYRYAMDYQQDNRQNGVILSVRQVKGNAIEMLTSQTITSAPNSQDSSTFEITRLDAIGDGSYLLEAKFTTNVFSANQTQVRVENGYLRFRVP